MMKTFSIGGIHPNDNKISKDCKIEVLPVPSKVFISVAQHLGAPATPVVKVGDQVKVGQVIAEPAGFISAYVHSAINQPCFWQNAKYPLPQPYQINLSQRLQAYVGIPYDS